MRRPMLVFAIPIVAVSVLAGSQEKPAAKKDEIKKNAMSDAAYTAQALSAAPKAVAKDAGAMRMSADGSMKMLRESKNGFTCMIIEGNKMCSDANSMAFFGAMMKGETPTDKLGLSYMLAGDNGASNTDPKAEKKTADNHWVVTGPHIMITGAAAKSLGLTEDKDPDPTKPYMMWAGTPYEHAMVPVGGGAKSMAKSAAATPEKQ